MAGRGFETTTGLVIQQGIWEESSIAKHKIGTRMQLADGRVFYYCQTNGGLSAGKLAESVVAVANHIECVGTIAGSVAAIGAKEVSFTLGATAATANQYAEGMLYTNKVTGLGYGYKVKSHTSASSAGNVTVTLYDPIQVATDATTEFSFAYNPFAEVILAATETVLPAGVSLIATTDNYYSWLQTWGMCVVYHEGTTASGAANIASASDGSVGPFVTLTELNSHVSRIVGHQHGTVGVAAEYTPVILQLYP
jgi:hemoglobin-like flavoprotein